MKKFLLLSFLILFLFSASAMGQGRTVSGKVISDEDGTGLPGVNVIIKGTSTGTITDIQGNYAIEVPNENAVLIFSFVGMATQEILVGDRTQINVEMGTDAKQLSEVVVTAVGIQRQKKSLGYATQQLDNEEITRAANPDVLQALVAPASVGSRAQQPFSRCHCGYQE